MKQRDPRISYIGIYPPTIARNAVALKGLRLEGADVNVYVTEGKGWKKYRSLIRLLRAHRETTDTWLVGYLSGIIVPFVRLFGRGKIVYNAANSFYESVVLDRVWTPKWSLGAWKIWFLDWLSFVCSDVILAESASQKRFLTKFFHLSEKKIHVVFTGADDADFYPIPRQEKVARFRVGFRGAFLPATGIECILDAAELLKDEQIDFFLYGRGLLGSKIQERIEASRLERVHLEERFLDQETLRTALTSCDVLLGQFSVHPRLQRTIQNKIFEALALHMPLITLRTKSNEEMLIQEESCLFIEKPDARLLAEAIMRMREDVMLRATLRKGAAKVYAEHGSPSAVGRQLCSIIEFV